MTLDQLFAGMPADDLERAVRIVGGCGGNLFRPDLVIAPDGEPYLYRWYLLPRSEEANLYFHIQVGDDPVRPLHDHPWDNHSVILAGGYDEVWMSPYDNTRFAPVCREFRKGACIARKAEEAHRLLLPDGITYTMTLFTTGPKVRDWGFWYEDGWHSHTRHVDQRDPGRHVYEEEKL
jgi:hypothetical protein